MSTHPSTRAAQLHQDMVIALDNRSVDGLRAALDAGANPNRRYKAFITSKGKVQTTYLERCIEASWHEGAQCLLTHQNSRGVTANPFEMWSDLVFYGYTAGFEEAPRRYIGLDQKTFSACLRAVWTSKTATDEVTAWVERLLDASRRQRTSPSLDQGEVIFLITNAFSIELGGTDERRDTSKFTPDFRRGVDILFDEGVLQAPRWDPPGTQSEWYSPIYCLHRALTPTVFENNVEKVRERLYSTDMMAFLDRLHFPIEAFRERLDELDASRYPRAAEWSSAYLTHHLRQNVPFLNRQSKGPRL